jgi:hypothetical protein
MRIKKLKKILPDYEIEVFEECYSGNYIYKGKLYDAPEEILKRKLDICDNMPCVFLDFVKPAPERCLNIYVKREWED